MLASVSDEQLDTIEGWFANADKRLFRFFLSAFDEPGDLAELGVYLGKSAVLLGAYRAPSERFTVIDLFDLVSPEDANAEENRKQYADLSQERFEANYRKFHHHLPTVIRGSSATIVDHATHGTHRFVHIDASHLYEHVVNDIDAARTLLRPQGVVVLDDYRSEHTPGVAAAVWQEIGRGLIPLVASPHKLYGTWGDPEPWREALIRWLPGSGLEHETQSIAGHPVMRVWPKNTTAITIRIPSNVIPYAMRLQARLRGIQQAAFRLLRIRR